MPHSSDDPPSVTPAESVESEAPSANPPSEAAAEAASPPSPSRQDGEPRRPRRRRRRHRPPPAPGSQSGGEPHTEQTASAGETAVVEDLPTAPSGDREPPKPPRRRRRRRRGLPGEAGSQQATASGDAQAEVGVSVNDPPQSASAGDPAQSQRPQGLPHDNVPREHRRRHRQRRPPREGGPTDPKSGNEGQSGSEVVGDTVSRSGSFTNRGPGIGGPRNRRPRGAGPREGEQQGAGSRPWNTGPRDPSGRGSARRDQGARDQGARARGPRGKPSRDRNQERGRDAQQRKPEQKLYALEAVVDRGFEDVTDEADESVTRRVHWTIIKRTVADQKTGKAMSAVYVLQREGVDSEYPNLGAARAAVNKTIVHPEKLTLSKAEHAAAKK